jgi:Ca2+-binding EF-hand superfamily protein
MVIAYLMIHHPHKMAALNDLTEAKPIQHRLVVIDFDNNGLLDEAELLQGKDGIIVVSNPNKGVDESFNSASAFEKLDVNKDGFIDEKDPMFRYMELMFFTDGGKGRRVVSFAQEGIKSVKVDTKRIKQAKQLTSDVKDNLIGEANLSDGKKLSIRLIMVSVPNP